MFEHPMSYSATPQPSPIESVPPPEFLPQSIEDVLTTDTMMDDILTNPEIGSYMSIDFKLSPSTGRELAPRHRLGFVIPEAFRHRIVRDVILRHRKDAKHAVDIGADRHDPHGAYSRVELHETDKDKDGWVEWQDPKGYDADKFAEPRSASDPENEVLHDWIATVGKITADAVRVTNVGQHSKHSTSSIHGVEIIFHPELSEVDLVERIYCPGTTFIDIAKNELLPRYGGGSATEGKYIGALPLNQRGSALYELGSDPGPDARLAGSQLEIELAAGEKLTQVEVAIGDTEHLATVSAKTNRRTRLGYAKLWVGIFRAATGQVDWFIKNANIPPQGVLAGGPHIEDSTINQGDKLIIESRDDAAYLMGWRLAYRKD